MTKPRRALVSLDDTPYYHCVSRCVRRAFLCGEDRYSGNNYSHRKAWVRERLQTLSNVFAIELCAYAVMSNHYHLVVYINSQIARSWDDAAVIERWLMLFRGPEVVQRYRCGDALSEDEQRRVGEIAEQWRDRLTDISWYMRCLNEHLARLANAEDGVTGRFWEGRYRCQALLDEAALVTAMAYVDLNPVRAGVADSLEDSIDTSVEQRLREVKNNPKEEDLLLVPFAEPGSTSECSTIPHALQDYLTLVDDSGRAVHPGKRGTIAEARPKILESLGISPDEWIPTVTQLQRRFELAMGSPMRLRAVAKRRGRKFFRGYRVAQRLYI